MLYKFHNKIDSQIQPKKLIEFQYGGVSVNESSFDWMNWSKMAAAQN